MKQLALTLWPCAQIVVKVSWYEWGYHGYEAKKYLQQIWVHTKIVAYIKDDY
jgi:hypothetical protein